MALKPEMFTPVLAWLDAGAPHTREGVDHQVFFNMDYFLDTREDIGACGTVCCIAGAIDIFNNLGIDAQEMPKGVNVATAKCEKIGEIVGMTPQQVNDLFIAENNPYLEDNDDRFWISPAEAASAIRSMLATGEVVWSRDDVSAASTF